MNDKINLALLRLTKRAETADPKVLVTTFVDTGMLQTMLSSRDHQAIYGRRGTGKTHALIYLSETKRQTGEICIFVDMRIIGSSVGLFADDSIPLPERATRLLRDTLTAIHDRFIDIATSPEESLDLGKIGPFLDAFVEAATETQVLGETISESHIKHDESAEAKTGAEVTLSHRPSVSLNDSDKHTVGASVQHKTRQSGHVRHRVRFGAIAQTLGVIAASIAPRRIWVLLDEWSSVPIELQPYLADMIRRCLLPVQGVTVKIAAIEQRTQFVLAGDGRGDYTGMELGADISADLNLDDFMVFDHSAARAMDFFRQLIFNHFRAVKAEVEGTPEFANSNEFAGKAFTQRTALAEIVRAAEGVPRDAINVLAICAQKAGSGSIAVTHARAAAKTWYQRDKDTAVSANYDAAALLRWIVDEVIAHRKARAFLVESGTKSALIDTLFDSRVLHILKRNISAQEQPGIRYDAFKIDYGCYVDLLSTAKAPEGLLPAGETDQLDGGYVDVPPDDYRAIRRAILDLAVFAASRSKRPAGGDALPANG